MRVSKTVREYIEKQVRIRLESKYKTEKKLAEEQENIVGDILEGAAVAAEAAYKHYMDEHFPAIADFAELNEGCYLCSFYRSSAISIKNRNDISSIHGWHKRMKNEVNEIMENIIVELELGGTKADLERLLNEVGGGISSTGRTPKEIKKSLVLYKYHVDIPFYL